MKQIALSLLGLTALALGGGCATTMVRPARPLPDDAIAPVIAVTSFENKSNYTGQWKLGTGMADLLVSELVLSRNFTVVERQHIDEVTGELKRQTDANFRQEGKADRGRLKNAQYLIRGTISDFSQVGGGAFWIALRNVFFMGKGYKARVALTLTIVEVESGVVVGSLYTTGLARAGEAYAAAKYKDVAFGGEAFFKTPLGVATANAVRRGIKGLIRDIPRSYWQPMIAEADEAGNIVINGGSARGLRIGDVFAVRGQGREVTDPGTGDVISVIPGPQLGTVHVTAVYDSISYARPLSGSGFKRGQLLVPPREL